MTRRWHWEASTLDAVSFHVIVPLWHGDIEFRRTAKSFKVHCVWHGGHRMFQLQYAPIIQRWWWSFTDIRRKALLVFICSALWRKVLLIPLDQSLFSLLPLALFLSWFLSDTIGGALASLFREVTTIVPITGMKLSPINRPISPILSDSVLWHWRSTTCLYNGVMIDVDWYFVCFAIYVYARYIRMLRLNISQ